jgi:hypothetical protein
MAKQVSADTAAAAAAAVAAGVHRKKSRQLPIGRFAAGSAENELADGQLKMAEQHLVRTIVCNNLPFKVSSLSGSDSWASLQPDIRSQGQCSLTSQGEELNLHRWL